MVTANIDMRTRLGIYDDPTGHAGFAAQMDVHWTCRTGLCDVEFAHGTEAATQRQIEGKGIGGGMVGAVGIEPTTPAV